MAENQNSTSFVKDNVYNVNEAPNAKPLRRSNFEATTDIYPTNQDTPAEYIGSDILGVPNWDIEDFINERLRYRSIGYSTSNSDVGSIYWEPGTYFYKLFFNFNTNYGLFGGILNTNKDNIADTNVANGAKEINTASMYFENNCKSERFSNHFRNVLRQKQISLFRFTQILHYLTIECPWVFKEVGGLENIGEIKLVDIATAEEKQIQIVFNEDAIDMRVSTIIDLYKHACYDTYNQKEIIPENLRKFDMSIIVFNPPIYRVNIAEEEAYKEKQKRNGETKRVFDGFKTNYSSLDAKNMPFKCIILKNCEIAIDALKSIADSISNVEGFKNNFMLTIKYQRSFVYSINNIYGTETLDNYYNKAAIELFTGEKDNEPDSKTVPNAPKKEDLEKIGPINSFDFSYITIHDKRDNYTFKFSDYGSEATYTGESTESKEKSYDEALKAACAALGITTFGSDIENNFYYLSEISYKKETENESNVKYICEIKVYTLKKEADLVRKHYSRKYLLDEMLKFFNKKNVKDIINTTMEVTAPRGNKKPDNKKTNTVKVELKE